MTTNVEQLKREYQDITSMKTALYHEFKTGTICKITYRANSVRLGRDQLAARVKLIAAGVGVLDIVRLEQEARDGK